MRKENLFFKKASHLKFFHNKSLVLCFFLFCYLFLGLMTQLDLIERKTFEKSLLGDFNIYEKAVISATTGKDLYEIRAIGPGYLYPPQALLFLEIFTKIKSGPLKAAFYTATNIALLGLIVFGVSKHYKRSIKQSWFWYVLCFAFAPFMELLQIGQINVFTMFGIFLMFIFGEKRPMLAGFGLGLAIVTKVSPLIFIGYLIVTKQYRTIIFTFVTLLLLSVISVLKYGISSLLNYPSVFVSLFGQFILDSNSQSTVSRVYEFLLNLNNSLGHSQNLFQRGISFVWRLMRDHYEIVQKILSVYLGILLLVTSILSYIKKQAKEICFIVYAIVMMLTANVMWYHHYVFLLLPLLIAFAWRDNDSKLVPWLCLGLLIVQIDRFYLTHGLIIHIICHLVLVLMLVWQIKNHRAGVDLNPDELTNKSVIRPSAS